MSPCRPYNNNRTTENRVLCSLRTPQPLRPAHGYDVCDLPAVDGTHLLTPFTMAPQGVSFAGSGSSMKVRRFSRRAGLLAQASPPRRLRGITSAGEFTHVAR